MAIVEYILYTKNMQETIVFLLKISFYDLKFIFCQPLYHKEKYPYVYSTISSPISFLWLAQHLLGDILLSNLLFVSES